MVSADSSEFLTLYHIIRFQEKSLDYSLFTDVAESLLTPDMQLWWTAVVLVCLHRCAQSK